MKRAGIALLVSAALLSGCSSSKPGGYYKDDGPHANPPSNLESVPDAVPKSEPLHKFANRPYTAMGTSYTPMTSVQPFRQRGVASWYGKRYHGQKTSSGEVYDMYQTTAAHPTLPIPSYARVTNTKNGKSLIVRVNDRGPYHGDRLIDVSNKAAELLEFKANGVARVRVEYVGRAPLEGSDDRQLMATLRTGEPAPSPSTVRVAS